MIPKVLFLTFLSWKWAQTPDHAPTDYSPALTRNTDSGCNRFSMEKESSHHHVAAQNVPDPEEVVIKVGEVQSAAAHSVSEIEEVVIKTAEVHTNVLNTENFDELPPGEWDPDTIVDKTFKLESSADTGERIYNVPDAFPDIPFDHHHAWGTYPNGSLLYIEFVDGTHKNSSITFSWHVDDKLVAADYYIWWFSHAIPTAQEEGNTKAGWTTIAVNASYNAIRIQALGGDPTGILLVSEFQYDPILKSK